jgi:hypothetical protein
VVAPIPPGGVRPGTGVARQRSVPDGPTRPRGTGLGAGPATGVDRRPARAETSVGGVRQVVPGPPDRSAVGDGRTGFRDPPLGAGRGLPGTGEPPAGSRPIGLPAEGTGRGLPTEGGLSGRTLPGEGTPGRGLLAEGAPTARGVPAEPGTAGGSGRGVAATGHGLLPLAGVARPTVQEHSRPEYLVDDTDAFADDRWFTPPVIGGDDDGAADA